MASLSAAEASDASLLHPFSSSHMQSCTTEELFLSEHLVTFLEVEDSYFQSSFLSSFHEPTLLAEYSLRGGTDREVITEILLRCGQVYKSVWSYFHAIDVKTCAPQLTRSRGFRGDSGNTLQDNVLRPQHPKENVRGVTILSDVEEQAYIKAMKCAQFPLQPLLRSLNLLTSPTSRPESASSVSSFVNGNKRLPTPISISQQSASSGMATPVEKEPQLSRTDEGVLTERELASYYEDLGKEVSRLSGPESGQPLPFLEHLHCAFHLSPSLVRQLAGRMPVNYNQRVQNLIEDFQVRLRALECNQVDLYSPKDFSYPTAYDMWRVHEDSMLRGVLQNLHGGRLPHAATATAAYRNSIAEYDVLFQKLFQYDFSTSNSGGEIMAENYGSPPVRILSSTSEFVLQEFRLRYCISDVYACLLHLQYLLCESHFQLNTYYLKHIEALCRSLMQTIVDVAPQERRNTIWEMDIMKTIARRLDDVIRKSNVERDALFYFSESSKESDRGGIECLLNLMCIIYQIRNSVGFVEQQSVTQTAFIEASVKRACDLLYSKIYVNVNRIFGLAPTESDLSYLIDFFLDKASKLGSALEPILGKGIVVSIRHCLYARLMEVTVLYFDERYHQTFDQPVVRREEMALIHQLNGLDAAWSSDIDHSCHLWRRQAFKLSTLWLKELERSCKKFMRASLTSCEFRLQRLHVSPKAFPTSQSGSLVAPVGVLSERTSIHMSSGSSRVGRIVASSTALKLAQSKNSAFLRSPRRRPRSCLNLAGNRDQDTLSPINGSEPAHQRHTLETRTSLLPRLNLSNGVAHTDASRHSHRHPPSSHLVRNTSDLPPIQQEENHHSSGDEYHSEVSLDMPQVPRNSTHHPQSQEPSEPIIVQTVATSDPFRPGSTRHNSAGQAKIQKSVPDVLQPLRASLSLNQMPYHGGDASKLVVNSSALVDFFCILRRFVSTSEAIKYLLTSGNVSGAVCGSASMSGGVLNVPSHQVRTRRYSTQLPTTSTSNGSTGPSKKYHSGLLNSEQVSLMRGLWQTYLKREMEVFLSLVRTFTYNLLWMDLCNTTETYAKTLFRNECLQGLLRSKREREIWLCRHKGNCYRYAQMTQSWCPLKTSESTEMPDISVIIRMNDLVGVCEMVPVLLRHHFDFCRMGETLGSDYRDELETNLQIFLNGVLEGYYQLFIFKILQPLQASLQLLPALSPHPQLSNECALAAEQTLHNLLLLFQRFLTPQSRFPVSQIVQRRIYTQLLSHLSIVKCLATKTLPQAVLQLTQVVKKLFSDEDDSSDTKETYCKLSLRVEILLSTTPMYICGACLLLSDCHPVLPTVDYLNQFLRHVFAVSASTTFTKAQFRRYLRRNPFNSLSKETESQHPDAILANLEAVSVLKLAPSSATVRSSTYDWSSDSNSSHDSVTAEVSFSGDRDILSVSTAGNDVLLMLALPKCLDNDITEGHITEKWFSSTPECVAFELALRMDPHVNNLALQCQLHDVPISWLLGVLAIRRQAQRQNAVGLTFLMKHSSQRDILPSLLASTSSCSIF